MKRTIIEIPLKTKQINEVLGVIDSVLQPAGYTPEVFNGQSVWSKGDGTLIKKFCVTAIFSDHSVILHGWTHDSMLGEHDLEGFAGTFIKKKLKELLGVIQSTIYSRGL
ncbi:MAG: hypothetical protein E7554_04395 [Ruminococcaceae bacterium]|nr:hypothetical protein [Oscillospiraceae bacterium]